VSGGCLEGDLAEHAREVIRTGTPVVVTYDMRAEADDLWGMGLGCSGMLKILLQRLSANDDWQPFNDLATAMAATTGSMAALIIASTDKTISPGTTLLRDPNGIWAGAKQSLPGLQIPQRLPATLIATTQDGQCELLCWILYPWPRLLLLGAGPDTVPLLELARTLGWETTVADHRKHYIDALPANLADQVRIVDAAQLSKQLALEQHTAVVVMSHHLDTDRQYLQQLAQYQHSYVGLLGPTARKARLLEELGLTESSFGKGLRGPVGLAIGADTPATIALAVLAEIQSLLHELR
jgi:xanthine/CO dehydrogenase XdhC/CoxF family maturation factor